MGCGQSSEAGGGGGAGPRPVRAQGAPLQIGVPAEVSIHIPRNRTDPHGVPIPPTTHDIDRPTLENALVLMADFLHERRARLTVIAVGGAVNTLFLQSRISTHDVDIFGANLQIQDRMLLDEAMQHAIRRSPAQLGTDWFNTENQMWLSPNLHRELTNEAIQQNVVVFNHPGLKLLAAPWEYAFSGKIQRLLTGGNQVRPYDLSDAVNYLHQIVTRNGGRPIPIAAVEQWARRYGHSSTRAFLLDRVNREYRKVYGSNGIV